MKTIVRASLVAVFCMFGLFANAQLNYYNNNYYYEQNRKVTVGVKAGINISDFTDFSEESANKVGFNAGITVDYAINRNLYLSSGLEFFNRKMKYDYEDNNKTTTELFNIPDGVIKAMYLQVPLHIGYKFELSRDFNISIHGGPYVAYGVGGRVEMGDWVYFDGSNTPIHLNDFVKNVRGFKRVLYTFEDDIKGRHGKGFKRFDWGLGLGLLLEYQRVGLGVNYDFGLQDVSRDGDIKVRTGYLTLGCKF